MGSPYVRGVGKFLILKNEDLDKYLSNKQEENLLEITMEVDSGRLADGKIDDNFYLIINRDEPYVQEVIEIMKKYGHWNK